MEIQQRTENNITILSLCGRLDAATSDSVSLAILELIEGGCKALVVDFAKLDYISSSGLRVFLLAYKRLGGVKGRLVFAALKEHVREVFDMAGLSDYFPIHATPAEAVESMQST
jgi:anti-anti-sigma factor